MNRCVVWLSIAVSVLVPLSGCTQPAVDEVSLDTEFTLAVGQTATVAGEDLSIEFVEVVSDSRCPKGATCVWAGEASCLVDITTRGSTDRVTLTQPGLSSPSTATVAGYDIAFDVLPYPELGTQTDAHDYRLALTVSKETELRGGVLATFDVAGERYSIFITREEAIEQVLAVQRGASKATIPNGLLVKGSVPYNQPWSWHIDPADVEMAEVTVELYDGTPSQVEDNLDFWIESIGRFAPWGATLIAVEDFR